MKELKKLNFGLESVGSFWGNDIDFNYLTDELAYKLGFKKNTNGTWEYNNYPEIELYELDGEILALNISKSQGYYGESDSYSHYLYVLRDETEKEVEVREKRQARELEKAEAKALKEKDKARLDKEKSVKAAKTVLEKAGYKVIK